METSQIILTVLFFLGVIAGFLMIPLMFYIERTRIKEMDKVVYGFEFTNDSIFFIFFRTPEYSLIFLSKLYAKKNGFDKKIAHLDKRFRWPFIAAFLLSSFIVLMMILAWVFKKYAGIE